MKDTCIGSNLVNVSLDGSSGSGLTAGSIDYCIPTESNPDCMPPNDADDWNVNNNVDSASMFSKFFRNFFVNRRTTDI